jgi:hypothetical protein
LDLIPPNPLAEHLHQLEQQAAATAALIDFDDADLVQQIADAWAPSNKRIQRVWLDWLRECGARWQQPGPVPLERPVGETVGLDIVQPLIENGNGMETTASDVGNG